MTSQGPPDYFTAVGYNPTITSTNDTSTITFCNNDNGNSFTITRSDPQMPDRAINTTGHIADATLKTTGNVVETALDTLAKIAGSIIKFPFTVLDVAFPKKS
ncbi:DgyrCDS14543 [Dimorphilus gyrociliatus]|uniref:DgyrCDS14543 n=1 Tax=Dimorphilus gyrociliatus TaxID=2664684 RepID=A0A7I8WDZ5_9ANNE|nr:DgyrCDS14543 [Dimorphilus gyrociliatus]